MATSALTPKVVTLGIADTEIVAAVPTSNTYRLDGILITNTDSAARTFRIHLYASPGTAVQTNALYYDTSVPANTTWALPFGPLTLPATWKMSGQASAASVVNVVITGFVQT